jgi:LysM repeat protein
MEMELVKNKIVLDTKIAKETTQVLLEGDIIVPDVKPDMAVMLQTDSKVILNRTEITTDRVSFFGKFEIQVLYLAHGNEKPVHSMSTVANIDDFVNMDGVAKDMLVEAKAEITNIEYKMLNDRKISYRAIVDVTVEVSNSTSHEIVVDITNIPENQLLKSTLNLCRNIENKTDKFIVKDQLNVPSGKPNIKEILQYTVTISNKDVRVHTGRVTVNGVLILTTLYKGDSENSLIEFTEHELPFNGTIEIPSIKDFMLADVSLIIQDEYIQVTQDSDGEDRVLDVEITIEALAKAHSEESIEVLEDAYCINKLLTINKTLMKYPRHICRNKTQSSIKEIVNLNESDPDLFQIFTAKGKAFIDDLKIQDDKVIAEGIIEATVLYVAESDETPLFSYSTVIPFRQVIETKGSHISAIVNIDVFIEHVSFNMLSGREIDLKYSLSFSTEVSDRKETNLITDIEFNEFPVDYTDKMASMTIYVVAKGDTIWQIAKQYNTSIDEILLVNDIENPAKITTGQKLLILKKVCVE